MTAFGQVALFGQLEALSAQLVSAVSRGRQVRNESCRLIRSAAVHAYTPRSSVNLRGNLRYQTPMILFHGPQALQYAPLSRLRPPRREPSRSRLRAHQDLNKPASRHQRPSCSWLGAAPDSCTGESGAFETQNTSSGGSVGSDTPESHRLLGSLFSGDPSSRSENIRAWMKPIQGEHVQNAWFWSWLALLGLAIGLVCVYRFFMVLRPQQSVGNSERRAG